MWPVPRRFSRVEEYIMNITRDTGIAFTFISRSKHIGVLLHGCGIPCIRSEESEDLDDDFTLLVGPSDGRGFKVLGVSGGEVSIDTYTTSLPPSPHWSNL